MVVVRVGVGVPWVGVLSKHGNATALTKTLVMGGSFVLRSLRPRFAGVIRIGVGPMWSVPVRSIREASRAAVI